MSRSATLQLVESLKAAGEDYEFYPTTSEMVGCVLQDLSRQVRYRNYGHNYSTNKTLMDVGAGDGKVLTTLREHLGKLDINLELFAIERSTIHINNMPKEVVIVGTEFHEQSLIDKTVDYVFCNPPYSEFESWAVKLIRESSCKMLYLIIPCRWDSSDEIRAALKLRGAKASSLGKFDFNDAERQARAVVDVLAIEFKGVSGDDDDVKSDPFDAAIEELLPELQEFEHLAGLQDAKDDKDRACEVIDGGENLIESLVKAYDAEIAELVENYRGIVRISPKLLSELGVQKKCILNGIRSKIRGRKEAYWKTLFDRFTPITTKLAAKQRSQFLDSLKDKAVIDFTEQNIYAVLIWITKQANSHFDDQLVNLFKSLSEFCNVVNYKSNYRVWTKGDWRYGTAFTDKHTNYKLEYRIVLQNLGGIYTGEWKFESRNGLTEATYEFLQDCITVANNLGFACDDSPGNYEWQSNKQNIFKLGDGTPLVAVRAFKNGNVHLHFNPKVMLAINVEAGRLLGWIRTPEEAAAELDDAEAAHYFKSSLRIGPNNVLRIAG